MIENTDDIAEAVAQISKSIKALRNGRLNDRAIVALVHDYSKLNKGVISQVINSLESLEKVYLKKKP